jgi:hypothetical protein
MKFLCYCFHDEAEVSKGATNYYKTNLSLLFCTQDQDPEGGGFLEGHDKIKEASSSSPQEVFL